MVGFCHLTDSHHYHHGQKPTMVGIYHGGNMPVGHIYHLIIILSSSHHHFIIINIVLILLPSSSSLPSFWLVVFVFVFPCQYVSVFVFVSSICLLSPIRTLSDVFGLFVRRKSTLSSQYLPLDPLKMLS